MYNLISHSLLRCVQYTYIYIILYLDPRLCLWLVNGSTHRGFVMGNWQKRIFCWMLMKVLAILFIMSKNLKIRKKSLLTSLTANTIRPISSSAFSFAINISFKINFLIIKQIISHCLICLSCLFPYIIFIFQLHR